MKHGAGKDSEAPRAVPGLGVRCTLSALVLVWPGQSLRFLDPRNGNDDHGCTAYVPALAEELHEMKGLRTMELYMRVMSKTG